MKKPKDTRILTILPEDIEFAMYHNPEAVKRLAQFVGSESLDPDDIAEACLCHALEQEDEDDQRACR